MLLALLVIEITPHWGGRAGGEIHRIYDKMALKDPPPASFSYDCKAFWAVALREIDRLPILAAAKPELQRFFRDVAPTFRVAIDKTGVEEQKKPPQNPKSTAKMHTGHMRRHRPSPLISLAFKMT